MRIISFCADGIRDAAQRGFFEWAADQDADIICVQNLMAREEDLQDEVFYPEGYNAYFWDHYEQPVNGVALYCRKLPKAIMTGLGFMDYDMEGRYIQADYDHISIGCLLAPSAYAPPGTPIDADLQGRRDRFFELFQNHLSKIRNKRRQYILCGNWTLTRGDIDLQDPEANRDRPGALPREQEWMAQLLGPSGGYLDAFREVSADPDEYSWWPDGQRGRDGWRVDHQILSADLGPLVEYGAYYKNDEFSSHAPLIMDYDYEL